MKKLFLSFLLSIFFIANSFASFEGLSKKLKFESSWTKSGVVYYNGIKYTIHTKQDCQGVDNVLRKIIAI